MEQNRFLSHSYQLYLDQTNAHQTFNIKNVNPPILVCPTCKSNSTILDAIIGETFCSRCGTVVMDSFEEMEKDPETNSRTGMPISLALYDKGLSTIIANSNIDAFGTTLNQRQISNINKIRYLDKISNIRRTKIRNLTRAFIIMSTIRDKLTLGDSVIERAAYYYRKALENNMMKGRAIREMVVASVFCFMQGDEYT